jgi:UDP-4-amino-4,6-dideoxy-N-acetyl-beta-L-altrosamine transaminase
MRKTFLPYALQWIDDEDIEAVVQVLKSDWITTGPKIQEFEKSICRYVECAHGIAVNSGTAALDIALASLGINNGEVITTPFTFAATANAILFNGLKPVFVDIEKDNFNIDPERIRENITEKTKAIIYVDFAGQPCDIKEIREIADEKGLSLIEDAAHALGSEYHGKKVGGFADITEFSFHPVKHITTGEGGICVTNSEELATKMSLLRTHGIDKNAQARYGPQANWAYDQIYLSRNYRITDFQAALGISQLKKIERFIHRRREIVEKYNKAFEGIHEINVPTEKSGSRHVWHLYTVLLNGLDRNQFFASMRRKNIGVNVHYIPVYKHTYYQNLGFIYSDCPVTEDVFKRIISLPLFPKMTDEDVSDVIDAVFTSIEQLR